jgi:hypothetical protein
MRSVNTRLLRGWSGWHAPPMSRAPVHQDHAAVAADEVAAAAARLRLREQGIVALEPDERVGVMLAPDERVIAVRRAISFERRRGVHDPEQGVRADLYVTTTRLLCLGTARVDIPLAEIREAVVAPGALRLEVGDGRGLEIRTEDPNTLRVELSAVREAARQAPSR